jgi:hypothetical protein
MIKKIPEQLVLRPELPVIIQNKDYHDYKNTLIRIDEILVISGIEENFVDMQLMKCGYENSKDEKAQAEFQKLCRRALRCNIARFYLEKELRPFSMRLADSVLLQRFCHVADIHKITGSSKSSLNRYDKFCTAEEIKGIVDELNRYAMQSDNRLNLAEDLSLEAYFSDTTCQKAHIHFPVDWVLLHDFVRTAIKCIETIRRHGLKKRMPDPKIFLRDINRLSMGMTLSRRKENSKKARKSTFRKMKQVAKTVTVHAQGYLDVLHKYWKETDLTEGQMNQIAKRLKNILEQIPDAIKQAHERIIGERKVKNENKILSLYEKDVHVIVRGKADAEIEFGNTLFLAEQPQGLIMDWKLEKEKSLGDRQLMKDSLERMNHVFGRYPGAVGADRGFWSKDITDFLKDKKIYNGVCPKPPEIMIENTKKSRFRNLQKRRAQTEGRIGILKNVFLGRPLRNKGFQHRERAVAWAILAHNLWLLSCLPQAEEKIRKKAA